MVVSSGSSAVFSSLHDWLEFRWRGLRKEVPIETGQSIDIKIESSSDSQVKEDPRNYSYSTKSSMNLGLH